MNERLRTDIAGLAMMAALGEQMYNDNPFDDFDSRERSSANFSAKTPRSKQTTSNRKKNKAARKARKRNRR